MMNLATLVVLGWISGAVETFSLPVGKWVTPVRAETLVQNRPLAHFLHDFDSRPGNRLLIRHAGGETETVRAEALRDALVAFGLPSILIELVPAAAPSGELILEISDNRE
jgi:hypothetical protein